MSTHLGFDKIQTAHRNIQLLSPELIHRIAAGEVVDRPASALKELVENAIDAGATEIKVQVVGGGTQSIQIDDNGQGFSKSDLQVAVQRHATSKIQTLEDLESIHTLGFRGEALAAISSVSKLSIESFSQIEKKSWRLEVIGGTKQPLAPGHRKQGTRVRVEDLFFNIPARKKFLKRPATEAVECLEVLRNLSLAQPLIRFEWHFSDERGEVKEQTFLEASNFLDRFMQVTGVRAQPLFVEESNPTPEVTFAQCVVLLSPAASRNQKSVHLSVNGRPLSDKRLPFALREAFTGLIEVGSFPYAHIHLTVNPEHMDINVHPQKKEVRWPANFSPASLAFKMLRPHLGVGASSRTNINSSLSQSVYISPQRPYVAPQSQATLDFVKSSPHPQRNSELAAQPWKPSEFSDVMRLQESSSQSKGRFLFRQSLQWSEPVPPFKFSQLRVVGEFQASYLLCEHEKALIFIDQHAAHERVNFERILKAKERLFRPRPLLVPLLLPKPSFFGPEECKIFSDTLVNLGFELTETFSDEKSFELITVPDTDRKIDWSSLIQELNQEILSGLPMQDFKLRLEQSLAASLACHGSVRQGQRLSNESIRALLSDLDALEWGGLCPHGRPIWIELDRIDLERFFHRA